MPYLDVWQRGDSAASGLPRPMNLVARLPAAGIRDQAQPSLDLASASVQREIEFISGLTAGGSVASNYFWKWYNFSGATLPRKWGSLTAGAAGGTVRYYYDPTWSAADKSVFSSSLALWSAVANISFVQTSNQSDAQIRISRSATGQSYSLTYTGANSGNFNPITSSTVYIYNSAHADGTFSLSSTLEMYIALHELGHALGLGHAGPYDGSLNVSAQYGVYDSWGWSSMSYISGAYASAPYYSQYPVTFDWGYTRPEDWGVPVSRATTWMPIDILAIQRTYGLPTSTPLSGGQVFGFNCNISGDIRPYFDFTQNTAPILTLWDMGTGNTLDLSGFSAADKVSLVAGTYSSVAGMTNNIAIALNTSIDTLVCGSGDSTVTCNNDGNSVYGGAGNDTLTGGAGNDTLDGGIGIDTAGYEHATAGVTVSLAVAGAQAVGGGSGSDTLISIENLTGSDYADALTGDGNDNVLTGGASNDALDGGEGFDRAVFSGNSSAYTVTFNLDGSTTVVGPDGTDTLRNVEEVDFLDTHVPLASAFVGTAGNDSFVGSPYDDTFDLTQGGDDIASALGGSDSFTMGAAFNAADQLDGGAGADILQMDGDYSGGLTMNATTMVGIETLVVAAGHDYAITSADASVAAGQTLTVNASALGASNALNFNGSAETDGSFLFIGGAGNDGLRGGAGSDTVDYSGAAIGVTVNLTVATAQGVGGGMGSDTLNGIENLIGSGYADTLIGDSGNNTLTGGGGADSLRPGLGTDVVSGGNGDDSITFTGGRFDASDAIDGGAGNDLLWLTGDYGGGVVMNATTLTNVENISVAAGFNYSLTTADATVGAGKTLSVDSTSLGASNSLTFDGSAETDGSFTLLTGAGADTLIGGGGIDTFRAGGGFDHVSGNGGNDSISFSLGHLDAADVIDGGTGTDLVWLNSDYTGANAVVFNASTLTNVETIALSASYNFSLTTADATVGAGKQLTVDGSSLGASKTLSFNGSAETDGGFVVIGGAGTDTLIGGNGTDTLSGRAGNDTLRPGWGSDVAFGGDGDDTISFTNGKLSATDIVDGGAGTDVVWLNGDYAGANAVTFNSTTMSNVEAIGFAAGFNYTLKSSDATVASGKTLTIDASALGASNALTFDGSAETNGAFTFVSGSGADNLRGGSGADTFRYDAASSSTGLHYDTINALNFANDSFDIPGGAGIVTGIDAAKTTGALSTASFDTDLATALASLGAHHAMLFTPNAGSLSGQTFMVVDCNGTAGYQSGQDLVIRLNGYSGALTAGVFH